MSKQKVVLLGLFVFVLAGVQGNLTAAAAPELSSRQMREKVLRERFLEKQAGRGSADRSAARERRKAALAGMSDEQKEALKREVETYVADLRDAVGNFREVTSSLSAAERQSIFADIIQEWDNYIEKAKKLNDNKGIIDRLVELRTQLNDDNISAAEAEKVRVRELPSKLPVLKSIKQEQKGEVRALPVEAGAEEESEILVARQRPAEASGREESLQEGRSRPAAAEAELPGESELLQPEGGETPAERQARMSKASALRRLRINTALEASRNERIEQEIKQRVERVENAGTKLTSQDKLRIRTEVEKKYPKK